MTRPPAYLSHQMDEKDVTSDWFFARGHGLRTIRQLVLVLAGWFFVVLPVVITASALAHRHNPYRDGWWYYYEGFAKWEVTTWKLRYLIAAFIVGFLALHVISRVSARRRRRRRTYDAARLARRLEIAQGMYRGKYGDEASRRERATIVIEPHLDIETYELRDLYRRYGVD